MIENLIACAILVAVFSSLCGWVAYTITASLIEHPVKRRRQDLRTAKQGQ